MNHPSEMTTTTITAPRKLKEYRKEARKHLKGHMWLTLLVTLICALLLGIESKIILPEKEAAPTTQEIVSTNSSEDFTVNSVYGSFLGSVTDQKNENLANDGTVVIVTPGNGQSTTVGDLSDSEEEEVIYNDSFHTSGSISVTNPQHLPVVYEETTIFSISTFDILIMLIILVLTVFVGSAIRLGYKKYHLGLLDNDPSDIRISTLFRFFKKGMYLKAVGLNCLYRLLLTAVFVPFFICSALFLKDLYLNALITFHFHIIDVLHYPRAILLTVIDFIRSDLLSIIIWIVGVVVTLLVFIPLFYSYAFAHTIMVDQGTGIKESLRSSRLLMRGKKMRLFLLDLSLIGWYLLSFYVTLGFGLFAVQAYHHAVRIAFYNSLFPNAEEEVEDTDNEDHNDADSDDSATPQSEPTFVAYRKH